MAKSWSRSRDRDWDRRSDSNRRPLDSFGNPRSTARRTGRGATKGGFLALSQLSYVCRLRDRNCPCMVVRPKPAVCC